MLLFDWEIDLTKFVGSRLLLAHSGGLDSSVLAHLLCESKVDFSVAHCNFQLRGSESDADAVFVETWCNENSIPFFSIKFDTSHYKTFHKKSTQVAARDLRYQWFDSLLEGYGFDFLLTAHHLNDQLETYLINTTRSTGLSGLLGIQEQGHIRRPLRDIPKVELIQYAKENSVLWREDSSNASDDYLRNSIRNHVIPALEKAAPNALQNFQSTLNHLTNTHDFIQASLESLKQSCFTVETDCQKIELRLLLAIPTLTFCVHHWFAPYGFNAKEVVKLIEAESGKVITSQTHRMIRDRFNLILTERRVIEKQHFPFDPDQINLKVPIHLKCEVLPFENSRPWGSHQAALDKKRLKKPLSIRKSNKGDYFYPTGMKGKKLLSKFFKDEKYSLLEKENQWLLCSDNQIVWVIGSRCDRRFVATKNTENALLISTV